ncbi:MAG: cupredoxin domain-containing protein [Sporichthyaceae bacterium]
MRLRTLATAGSALALALTLAACGGDDSDSAAQSTDSTTPATSTGTEPAAGAGAENCDPNAPGSCDAYDASDPFANPKARCPKGGEPAKTITASGNTFCEDKYAGKVGETWTFDNPDIALHNVATDDVVKNPAKFKTADVEMGKKATFKMPKKAGKYTIICTYHPGPMTAQLTLK